MISLLQLLRFATDQNASDLHIVMGSQPALRINGRMVRVKTDLLTRELTKKLCYSIINDSQKARFEEEKELDFSFEVKNMGRFRANFFFQKNAVSAVFRRIPIAIPKLGELGLPPATADLTSLPFGMVLVTGPTGSGKSTTIAALVDKINQERSGHIVTLEDPIEFVHNHKNCIVNQREVGVDTEGYRSALKYLLRQDPDVCVLGELRDLATIETGLMIAETGHLVLATLHTNSAVSTIYRLIGAFPHDQQERVRTMLSFSLQAVVSQRLLSTIGGGGRVVASELMVLNSGIRNLIREDKMHQIQSLMQMGQDKTGMVTMNQNLMQLILQKKIDMPTAFMASPDPDALDQQMRKAGV